MELLEMQRIQQAIATLERKNRRLTWGMCGILIICLITMSGFAVFKTRVSDSSTPSDILRVRGLVVVDENGTERVWVGAPLPEPLILGKRHPRGSNVSGILLFDEEGNERSGYVTSDGYPNVFFTLDSVGRQHVLFLNEPQGSPTLMLWDTNNNALQLSVNEESPQMKLTRQGEVIFTAPPAEEEKK